MGAGANAPQSALPSLSRGLASAPNPQTQKSPHNGGLIRGSVALAALDGSRNAVGEAL